MIRDVYYEHTLNKKEYVSGNIKMNVAIQAADNLPFGGRFFSTLVLVDLNQNGLAELPDYFESLLKILAGEAAVYRRISVMSRWLIFLDTTNEKLFNTINSKENRFYRNMDNRFAVINTNTWDILFRPGTIENRVISKRMEDLRIQPEASSGETSSLTKELNHVYDNLVFLLEHPKMPFLKKVKGITAL